MSPPVLAPAPRTGGKIHWPLSGGSGGKNTLTTFWPECIFPPEEKIHVHMGIVDIREITKTTLGIVDFHYGHMGIVEFHDAHILPTIWA